MFETLHVVFTPAALADVAHLVDYLRVRGRRVVEQGRCPLHELRDLRGASLRVAVDSSQNYTRRMTLEAFSPGLVPVIARRELEQEAIFSDRFRTKTDLLTLRDGKADVCLLAMAEADAQAVMENLPVQKTPLVRLALAESAVAALLGKVSRAPVLAMWQHGSMLHTLAVVNSRVMWQRVQRVDADAFSASSDWRAVVERNAAMAPPEYINEKVVRINLGQGPWQLDNAWTADADQDLVKHIDKLFKGVDANTVLASPHLFGLAFLPQRANLVVNGYRHRVRAWSWGRPAAALSACAGVALMVAGVVASGQADLVNANVNAEAATLAKRVDTVKASLPSDAGVKQLQSALELNDALRSGVRVDQMLAQLARIMPPDANATSIEVVRERPARPAGRTPSKPGSADNTFSLKLKIQLKGSYGQSKKNAELLVMRLAEMGELADTKMAHTHDQTGTGSPMADFTALVRLKQNPNNE